MSIGRRDHVGDLRQETRCLEWQLRALRPRHGRYASPSRPSEPSARCLRANEGTTVWFHHTMVLPHSLQSALPPSRARRRRNVTE
jgi:hypothetical protein